MFCFKQSPASLHGLKYSYMIFNTIPFINYLPRLKRGIVGMNALV